MSNSNINPTDSSSSDATQYPKPNFSEQACLAAGCFWGTEAYFKQLDGIIDTEVGYTGGHTVNPTYQTVCNTNTNHAEALLITFDPNTISYAHILQHFWRLHDPTSFNRQGNDIGSQYRSAIFYTSTEQQLEAEKQKAELQKQSAKKIVTEISPLHKFYPAETYHQDYLAKNPGGYCHIDLSLAKKPLPKSTH